MEQGAALTLDGDVLTVNARNDIYIRYLSDNRATIAELASEFFARPIKVEVSSNGTVVSSGDRKGTNCDFRNRESSRVEWEHAKPATPEAPKIEPTRAARNRTEADCGSRYIEHRKSASASRTS